MEVDADFTTPKLRQKQRAKVFAARRTETSKPNGPRKGNRNKKIAGTCYTCGESGHKSSECPKKVALSKSGVTRVTQRTQSMEQTEHAGSAQADKAEQKVRFSFKDVAKRRRSTALRRMTK